MVLKTFENVHMILTRFIFQLQYHWLEKELYPYWKTLRLEKSSLLLWNIFEIILDQKKKSDFQNGLNTIPEIIPAVVLYDKIDMQFVN